jgi:hypothetical protein
MVMENQVRKKPGIFLFILICFLTAPAWAQDTTVSTSVDDSSVKNLTFDDIKFEMEVGDEYSSDMLTEKITALKGSRISLRGYIHPTAKATGNTTFVLVRDNQECCFGPGAALYDCVLIKLQADHSVDFTVRPVTVEGEFMIKEFKVGGQIMAIFRMKDGTVSQ